MAIVYRINFVLFLNGLFILNAGRPSVSWKGHFQMNRAQMVGLLPGGIESVMSKRSGNGKKK